MKKQELNLTDEEKVEFLRWIKFENPIKYVRRLKILRIIHLCLTVGMLGSIILKFNAPFLTCSLLIAGIDILDIIYDKKADRTISDYSKTKLTYDQYKYLVKSGELAKWKEQFRDQLEFYKPLEVKNLPSDTYTQTNNTTYTKDFKQTDFSETKNINIYTKAKQIDNNKNAYSKSKQPDDLQR